MLKQGLVFGYMRWYEKPLYYGGDWLWSLGIFVSTRLSKACSRMIRYAECFSMRCRGFHEWALQRALARRNGEAFK